MVPSHRGESHLVVGQNVIDLRGIGSPMLLTEFQNARGQGMRCTCDGLARDMSGACEDM